MQLSWKLVCRFLNLKLKLPNDPFMLIPESIPKGLNFNVTHKKKRKKNFTLTLY